MLILIDHYFNINMTPYSTRKQWFLSRIGKRVFRNETSCTCNICKHVSQCGLVISDESHAIYLLDCECEYTNEGHPLRYFDTKEKVEQFIKGL